MLDKGDLLAIREMMEEVVEEKVTEVVETKVAEVVEEKVTEVVETKVAEVVEEKVTEVVEEKVTEVVETKVIKIVDDRIRESENLVLGELDLVQEKMTASIEEIKASIHEMQQYYRIKRLEEDNTRGLIQMIQKVQKDVDELKAKIV